MSNSLRLVPLPQHPTTFNAVSFSAPSAPGLNDKLRSSLFPASTSSLSSQQPGPQLQSRHPLESRLAQWEATQTALHATLLRREFGLAAPLQRDMELLTVRRGAEAHRAALGDAFFGDRRTVHADILAGTDWEIAGWEDVFTDGDVFAPMAEVYMGMERSLGMDLW